MSREPHVDGTYMQANEMNSHPQYTTPQAPAQVVPEPHSSGQPQSPSRFLPPQNGLPFDHSPPQNIERQPAVYAAASNEIAPDKLPGGMYARSHALQRNGLRPLSINTNIDPQGYIPHSPTMSVAPDANPLQSPKLSYFPPPITPGTTDLTIFHRPGQISHPNLHVKGGTWKHGLCDCTSIGTCCLGLICPCILYGKTQYRLSMKSNKQDPTNMLGYKTCNGPCTAMAVLCGCQWLMATIQHTRTRKTYAIQGNIASDCVRATCCMCCTLIQDEKEIRKREEEREKALREAGAPFASQYLTPMPMSYTPALI